MAKLMMHKDVLKNFHRLPTKVQKRVSEIFERFEKDPYDPVIGLHGLKSTMKDPKVRGAYLPSSYRAIIIAPEKGETFVLVHIDHHDEAYEWARNKRFEVHGMTGVFQIYEGETFTEKAVSELADLPSMEMYPIANLSDDDLFKAGVPKPLIPAVKAIHSDEQLEAVEDYLPPDCRDVLTGIAAGMTLNGSLEEMLGLSVLEQVDVRPETPGDFSKIEIAPRFDLVLIEGEEDLKDALQASLEDWRIFLHPYQRKLVEWETKGPVSYNGAAGTGKTVVLLHRAAHLAGKLADPKDRVLVTTFTTNLVATLRAQLQRLDPGAAERIDFTNLHALARNICIRAGWKGRIAEPDDIEQIWDEALNGNDQEDRVFTGDELRREYELIIDANGIDGEDAYLTTVRTGRPRISRKQRRDAWPFFRSFQRGLKKRNLLTFEGAVHEARLAAEQGRFQRYAHVLVDEAQDFSLEALRLIRVISPIDDGTRDPLCIVGDGHQRIYRTRVPVSRSGIAIRGRSRRLKINYRTSEQIRKYAQGILQGLEIDDLDDGVVTTFGDRSVFKGPEPMIETCENEEVEVGAVVAWVDMLMKDYNLASHEICVAPYKSAIRTALEGAGLPTLQLKPRMADPGETEPGIRMGTIYRIKGLEFRAVALVCAASSDPMNDITNAESNDRCARYVAATRAREHLLITVAKSSRLSSGTNKTEEYQSKPETV